MNTKELDNLNLIQLYEQVIVLSNSTKGLALYRSMPLENKIKMARIWSESLE